MKHVMVRWGTSGLMLLALAGCDGGSGQPASPAATANEPVPPAPALVVSEASAPASPVAVESPAAALAPPPVVAKKVDATPSTVVSKPAPAPPLVVVTKAAPTPPPAVVKAPPPVAIVVPTPTPPPAVIVAAVPPPPAVASTAAPARTAADPDAAQALFKANDCTKCHAVDKVKKGPSLKKIAADLRGSADAQGKVIKNMTTGPKIKLADGTEQEHKIIDTKDQKELKNLADWILSQ